MVIYRDARTRELAEFFELPNQADYNRHKSLYEMYLEADYTAFNRNFTRKFQAFEHFMVSYGISHDLDDRSLFGVEGSNFARTGNDRSYTKTV